MRARATPAFATETRRAAEAAPAGPPGGTPPEGSRDGSPRAVEVAEAHGPFTSQPSAVGTPTRQRPPKRPVRRGSARWGTDGSRGRVLAMQRNAVRRRGRRRRREVALDGPHREPGLARDLADAHPRPVRKDPERTARDRRRRGEPQVSADGRGMDADDARDVDGREALPAECLRHRVQRLPRSRSATCHGGGAARAVAARTWRGELRRAFGGRVVLRFRWLPAGRVRT
jgi:hypothetical protein